MKTKLPNGGWQFDKYPAVWLVESCGRYITKNPEYAVAEYAKQLTLMQAKYKSPCELPYSINRLDDSTEAGLWASGLAVSHVGQNGFLWVPPERFWEFEADVMAIDFLVYDPNKERHLAAKYARHAKSVVVPDVDALAIVMGDDE